MAQGAGYSFNSSTVTGSTVRDLAGYFMYGTITGSAAITSGGGKYGDGLNCTGGAMQVANIDHYFYPVNTDGGISVAAWVKLNTTTAAARCIASATSNSALSWAVYASNATGNVEVKIAGVTYSTSTSIRDGAFHHVMMVVDAVPATDTLNVYVDGTSVLSTTLSTSLTYPGNVTMEVGRNVLTAGEALNGVVDDYRWWNDPVESTYVSTVVGAEQIDFQIAIYPFDDGSTNDFSIYGRNLTAAGTATYGPGLYGRAISSGTVEAAASAAVNLGDLDRLAFTGWLRLDTAPSGSAKPILSMKNTGGTEMVRVVVNLDRTVTATWVTIHGTYSVTSGTTLTVGQWSRFQFAMNPTYVSIRLNSASQTTTNSSNPTPHLSPTVLDLKTLYVGGDSAGGGQVSFDYLTLTKNFLDTVVDIYWTGPPTPAALKPANVARGVYEFNEGSGTVAADRSGSGNDLTLTANGSWTPGVQGSALNNTGTAAAGALKASGLTWDATPKGWAVSGWFKCRPASAGARILVLRNASSEVAHMFYLSGTFQVRLYGSGGTTGLVNPNGGAFPAETLTHVAASCNGSTIQFFLNGAWYGSATYTVGTLLAPTELNVGGDPADGSNQEAADVIDSLTLFDTPLSSSNIAWLYQNPGLLMGGTPVANTRAITWNTKAQASGTRALTWDTRTVVSGSRSSTWNVLGALSAVSAFRSTTWDTLGRATGSRAISWSVLTAGTTPVSTARSTSWRVLQMLSALKKTTWQVGSDNASTGFTVKFPTYRVPLGTVPPLNRQWMDMPKALVKYKGEWLEVAVPYNELLMDADKFYLGGYKYELTSEEVADLPPQYVEAIS